MLFNTNNMEQVIVKYKTNYSNVVTKNELIVEIKRCGIKGYSKKKKNELIDMLEKQMHCSNEYSLFENMVYTWYMKNQTNLDALESKKGDTNIVLNDTSMDKSKDDDKLYDEDLNSFAEILYESDVVMNQKRVMNKRIQKAEKLKLWDTVSNELRKNKLNMINSRINQLRSLSTLNLAANMKQYEFKPLSNKLQQYIIEYESHCKERETRFAEHLDNMKIVVYSFDDKGVLKACNE